MAVIEHNLDAFWLTYDGIGERVEPEHAIAYFSDAEFGLLNPVVRFRSAAADADAVIERLLVAADDRGVDQWWWGGPGDEPADLGRRLTAAGLNEYPAQPGMARSLEGWSAPDAPDGLEIETVSAANWDDYLRVFFASFELPEEHRPAIGELFGAVSRHPSITSYLGRHHGEPMGCATLLLDDAGTAGVWNIGTLESARGRGIGTAMTALTMAEGAARGATTAILIATPMGEPIYRSMGFEKQCEMPMWSRL